MEAVCVALRPKENATITQEFNPRTFDVLLTDFYSTHADKGSGNGVKKLPHTPLSFEEEPSDNLLSFIYELTGADIGGLKGKRAVYIPTRRHETNFDSIDKSATGTLYCIPIDSREKLNLQYVSESSQTPGFYSLDNVLDTLDSMADNYSPQTRSLLKRLASWLHEKHKVPGAIDLLFASSSEFRLRRSVGNPAHFVEGPSGLFNESYNRSIANEAFARMMMIEKCNKTVMNPLFNAPDMNYRTSVVAYTINVHWGRGVPDLSKLKRGSSSSNSSGDSLWRAEYPLHRAAMEGDVDLMRDLLVQGYPVKQRDPRSWLPMHYAAFYGQLKALSVLLEESDMMSSPNIATGNSDSTALHLAASAGHVYIVELLLSIQHLDINALNRDKQTAHDLVQDFDDEDHRAVLTLLNKAKSRPPAKIQIFLMDGTFRTLNLVSGANTTVEQLHIQMMLELQLPEECKPIFNIWICSRNLQLQLRSAHKVLEHLNNWTIQTVPKFCDHDPSREEPSLSWRRDAMLPLSLEVKVVDPVAINLLFSEAYHNYSCSLYPCSEQDVIKLSTLLLQMNQGDYDQRKTKAYLSPEGNGLSKLIPESMIKAHKNWASKISRKYQQFSEMMMNRDKSPIVLQKNFLATCWNLMVYGSAFFAGYIQFKANKAPTTVCICVNDVGLHIIQNHNKSLWSSFKYTDVEWTYFAEEGMLSYIEFFPRDPSKSEPPVRIISKQSLLINNLMEKLSTQALRPL